MHIHLNTLLCKLIKFGEKIYLSQIDSLAHYNLYNVRKEALNATMQKYILENEAKQNNISIDSLILFNIESKIHINSNELNEFIESSIKSALYIDFVNSQRTLDKINVIIR